MNSKETEEKQHIEIVKKSALYAKDVYDFQKLARAGEHFLPLQWELREEDVIFGYQLARLKSFTDIRKEKQLVIYNILIQMAKLEKDWKKYSFSMEPANLYFNDSGEWYIKNRDLPIQEEGAFFRRYISMVACVLTGQYSYKEYLEGGTLLLKKEKITEAFYEMETVGQIVAELTRLRDEKPIRLRRVT